MSPIRSIWANFLSSFWVHYLLKSTTKKANNSRQDNPLGREVKSFGNPLDKSRLVWSTIPIITFPAFHGADTHFCAIFFRFSQFNAKPDCLVHKLCQPTWEFAKPGSRKEFTAMEGNWSEPKQIRMAEGLFYCNFEEEWKRRAEKLGELVFRYIALKMTCSGLDVMYHLA